MRRGIEKQLMLPFDADEVDDIYGLFKEQIPKWHKLQDAPKSTSGNCYWWWSSRFGEWMQESYRPRVTVERYLKVYRIFSRIWERYEQIMTRNQASGVPKAALE